MRFLRLITLAVLLLTPLSLCYSAAVPTVLSYQGRLMQSSNQPVADGNYVVHFAIYSVSTGGTAVWVETNPHVSVKNGLFSVLLGSTTPLANSVFTPGDRYFGIAVGTDPEMTPRQKIATAAFSFRSDTASNVDDDSITSAKIVNAGVATADLADGAVTSAKLADQSVTANKLASGATVPVGGIIMWSGSSTSIPTGWALCDGQNGTPDLRDRFLVGSGGTYATGTTGGVATLNLQHSHTSNDHTHDASHNHASDSAGSHSHHMDFWSQVAPQYYPSRQPTGAAQDVRDFNHTHQIVGDTWGSGSHSHNIQTKTFNTGSASNRGTDTQLSATTDIRPPYFALAFIMKLP